MKIFTFFLLALVYHHAVAQENIYRNLSVKEFKAGLDSVSDEVLLDLRTPEEISKGIIPGAINIDYFNLDFEKQVAKLDRNKIYFLYCAVGGRSGETIELMEKLGFREVYNLNEGFTGWQKHKFPIEKAKK